MAKRLYPPYEPINTERSPAIKPAPHVLDDPREKLLIMRDIKQFMPISKQELDDSFTLATDQKGAANQLREIGTNMRRREFTYPDSAVRAVTRRYIGYCRGTKTIMGNIDSLRDALVQPLRPSLRVSEAAPRQMNGVRALMQFADVTAFAEGGDNEANPLLVNYFAPYNEVLVERANEFTVRSVNQLLPGADNNLTHRYGFWREQIDSLRAHRIAAPIIEQAIGLQPL